MLLVDVVQADGAAAAWNLAHPEQALALRVPQTTARTFPPSSSLSM